MLTRIMIYHLILMIMLKNFQAFYMPLFVLTKIHAQVMIIALTQTLFKILLLSNTIFSYLMFKDSNLQCFWKLLILLKSYFSLYWFSLIFLFILIINFQQDTALIGIYIYFFLISKSYLC